MKKRNFFILSNGIQHVTMDENGYKQVALIAAKIFAGIRFFFVKYVRNKLNAFFLNPM